jgi:signal peptidase I
LRPIERDDVVVFNFPAGDTVLLENTAITYYDVLRDYQRQLGAERGRAQLARDYTIVSRPVDKRENYVKRLVGLPGDTIRIVASRLYVNGAAQKEIPGLQLRYDIATSAPFSYSALDEMGIALSDVNYNQATGRYIMMPLTAANLQKIGAMGNVISVEQVEFGGDVFPDGSTGWTENDFGPLWIPSRGATVALTLENLPLYERIIDAYEGNDLEVRGDTIYVNGVATTSYTFRMDYYWMMGDNRQNSLDSRFWGFVPEDHIVGKASFVWLSLDAEKGWFDGKVRLGKMFRKIR